MKINDVMNIMKQELADMYGITPAFVDDGTIIDNLGLDSLDRTEYCMEIEAKLDIELDNEDVYEAKTVGELAQTILKTYKQKNRAANGEPDAEGDL